MSKTKGKRGAAAVYSITKLMHASMGHTKSKLTQLVLSTKTIVS